MEKKEGRAAMRIFFHGNNRYAGFILPVTIAAVLICTVLYCACFALISARHELVKKQTVEWDAELERHNAEVNAKYGTPYAAD
jgi:prolyl-tRNA synthetase